MKRIFSSYLYFKRFGPWPFLIMAAVIFIMIGVHLHRENSLAETEKQLAFEECLKTNPDGGCREQIDKYHEECFRGNYYRGSRSNPGGFDRAGYRRCLELGLAAWQQENREKLAAENEARRKATDGVY